MKLVCPYCNTAYNIPDNKLPAKKINATCKRCSKTIVIDLTPGADSAPNSATEPPRGRIATPAVETKKIDRKAAVAVTAEYPELKELSSGRYEFGEIFSKTRKG